MMNAPFFHAATAHNPSERILCSISVPPTPMRSQSGCAARRHRMVKRPAFSYRDHAHRQPRTIRPNEVSMISAPPTPIRSQSGCAARLHTIAKRPAFSCRDCAHRQPRTIHPNEASMISAFARAHAKSIRLRGAPSQDGKTPSLQRSSPEPQRQRAEVDRAHGLERLIAPRRHRMAKRPAFFMP